MVKSLSKSRVWIYLALPFMALLITLGCKQENTVSPEKRFSGQELFRGIVLKQGDVAGKIPLIQEIGMLNTMSAAEKLTVARFNGDIIAKIEEMNPSFFSDFQRKIQSGDQLQVKNGINQAVAAFYSAVKEFPEYTNAIKQGREMVAQIDIKMVSDANGAINAEKLKLAIRNLPVSKGNIKVAEVQTSIVLAVVIAVYFAVGVEVVIVSNVAVAVAGYLALALYGPMLEKPAASQVENSNLMSEIFVNQVTENLSANTSTR
jgi:SdpC family antimicrobial peptide